MPSSAAPFRRSRASRRTAGSQTEPCGPARATERAYVLVKKQSPGATRGSCAFLNRLAGEERQRAGKAGAGGEAVGAGGGGGGFRATTGAGRGAGAAILLRISCSEACS